MTVKIKHLLEIMFYTGTANPCQKMNIQQIHEKLAQQGELCEENIPKVSTIQNWISGFSQRWKEAMALRSIDKNEHSLQ